MAIAVSLVPKVLRPVENLFEAGESPVSEKWFIPKYDPTKTYTKEYLGNLVWFSGELLNYMDDWQRESHKRLYDHWKSKQSK